MKNGPQREAVDSLFVELAILIVSFVSDVMRDIDNLHLMYSVVNNSLRGGLSPVTFKNSYFTRFLARMHVCKKFRGHWLEVTCEGSQSSLMARKNRYIFQRWISKKLQENSISAVRQGGFPDIGYSVPVLLYITLYTSKSEASSGLALPWSADHSYRGTIPVGYLTKACRDRQIPSFSHIWLPPCFCCCFFIANSVFLMHLAPIVITLIKIYGYLVRSC